MRTHPLNVTHLVFGLAFLGIAGCWALTEAGVVDAGAGWLVPLVLLVAGAIGLVAALAQGLRRTPRPEAAVADDLFDELSGDLPEEPTDDEQPTTPL